MKLLPAPKNDVSELRLKLQTLVASKLKLCIDQVKVRVSVGDKR